MKPRRVPEGVRNRVKTGMKKDAQKSRKIMNFQTPEGRAKSTPAAPLMQVICMERKTAQKKESRKPGDETTKEPRLGPCGPERIL